MTENQLVHLYFCLEERSRKVVAAFSEFRIAETDERYVKRAHHPDGPGGRTEWLPVEGAPEEMVSTDYDVYSMPIDSDTAFDEHGFITAVELFSDGKLTEQFLEHAANFIPHRM